MRNITQASVLPVLPAMGKGTGEAAVIFPGGGFMTLSYDWEGVKVAQALANRGIAAFVVKYRLVPTPRDETSFKNFYDKQMSAWVGKPGERLNIAVPTYAIEDGKAALALVRSRAKAWKIDPTRVGVMGFSAGAMAALRVATASTGQQRPAFAALLYPPMESIQVPNDAPPAFVAMALDDPLSGRAGFGLIESWMHAGRPIEFHGYQKGKHGFSLGRERTTTLGWIDQFVSWLQMNGPP
ncbi:acetyl esterase/lipase [Novosphingobium fluoreni]|uniref:Acetyl esterase/lipase n=1 Tax=Novosphingobium fluoreni TaxID=1391222 RepID=A0A7W6G0W0_9SPHN|nr:acetyl esterase/lipase [Novosphingobium fluoreni]